MDILSFKSSTVRDPGCVFPDSCYPPWSLGVQDASSSSFSDQEFNCHQGKPWDKVNWKFLSMMRDTSYSNLHSTDEDHGHEYYQRPQPPKWTNDPSMQTQDAYDILKTYRNYYNQEDHQNHKYADLLSGLCGESTGFAQSPKELINVAFDSANVLNRPTPSIQRSRMSLNKSDVQLLNRFANSSSWKYFSDQDTQKNLRKQSVADSNYLSHMTFPKSVDRQIPTHYTTRRSERPTNSHNDYQQGKEATDLHAKFTDDKPKRIQYKVDALLAYDPRWTFAAEPTENNEIPHNIEAPSNTVTSNSKWELKNIATKPTSPIEILNETFENNKSVTKDFHSDYSTRGSSSTIFDTDLSFSSIKDVKSKQESTMSISEKQSSDQNTDTTFDLVTEDLNEGLNIGADSDYRGIISNKWADSEIPSNDSLNFCFPGSASYVSEKSEDNRPTDKMTDNTNKCLSSQTFNNFERSHLLENYHYNIEHSQKSKTAKVQPEIKTIEELKANPYENAECVFCKGNDQTEEVYLSHPIRVDNVIVCPYLRKYVCAICKAHGDGAHTIKYCPFNKRGFFAMREKFPPPNKSMRPTVQAQDINMKKGKVEQNIWKPKSRRCDSIGSCRSDNSSLYSSTSSLTSTISSGSSCYSDVVNNNRTFFQNLEKLRKNPKKQDIGCRST